MTRFLNLPYFKFFFFFFFQRRSHTVHIHPQFHTDQPQHSEHCQSRHGTIFCWETRNHDFHLNCNWHKPSSKCHRSNSDCATLDSPKNIDLKSAIGMSGRCFVWVSFMGHPNEDPDMVFPWEYRAVAIINVIPFTCQRFYCCGGSYIHLDLFLGQTGRLYCLLKALCCLLGWGCKNKTHFFPCLAFLILSDQTVTT